jgi:hypothetical protein
MSAGVERRWILPWRLRVSVGRLAVFGGSTEIFKTEAATGVGKLAVCVGAV